MEEMKVEQRPEERQGMQKENKWLLRSFHSWDSIASQIAENDMKMSIDMLVPLPQSAKSANSFSR